MDDRVQVTISGGIADVRMVRADKMNALDAAMFEALVAAAKGLAARRAYAR
jgi:enoyl-CoA hydratase/carnithine racemase